MCSDYCTIEASVACVSASQLYGCMCLCMREPKPACVSVSVFVCMCVCLRFYVNETREHKHFLQSAYNDIGDKRNERMLLGAYGESDRFSKFGCLAVEQRLVQYSVSLKLLITISLNLFARIETVFLCEASNKYIYAMRSSYRDCVCAFNRCVRYRKIHSLYFIHEYENLFVCVFVSGKERIQTQRHTSKESSSQTHAVKCIDLQTKRLDVDCVFLSRWKYVCTAHTEEGQ